MRLAGLVLAPLLLTLSGCALLGNEVGRTRIDDGTDLYSVDCGTVNKARCARVVDELVREYRHDEPGIPVVGVGMIPEEDGTLSWWVCGRASGTSAEPMLRCSSGDHEDR